MGEIHPEQGLRQADDRLARGARHDAGTQGLAPQTLGIEDVEDKGDVDAPGRFQPRLRG